MPTEISLSRKVGIDLINIKTDLEPEAAVGLFADLVTLVATANEVGQLPDQSLPAPTPAQTQAVAAEQGYRNVTQQLSAQPVQPQHTDPRAPGYAQGPPPFEPKPNHYTPDVGWDREPRQQPQPQGPPRDNGAPAKVCDHGKMVRFDGVSKKTGQPYVRWDCPAGQKPCVKWGN